MKLLEKAKEDNETNLKIASVWMVGEKHIFEDGFGRPYSIPNGTLFELWMPKSEDLDVDKAKRLLGALIKKRVDKVIKKEKIEELTDPFVEKIEKYLRNPDLND